MSWRIEKWKKRFRWSLLTLKHLNDSVLWVQTKVRSRSHQKHSQLRTFGFNPEKEIWLKFLWNFCLEIEFNPNLAKKLKTLYCSAQRSQKIKQIKNITFIHEKSSLSVISVSLIKFIHVSSKKFEHTNFSTQIFHFWCISIRYESSQFIFRSGEDQKFDEFWEILNENFS